MRYLLSLLCLFTLMSSCNSSEKKETAQNTTIENQEVTTYYLIRHAEKDRTDPHDHDPSLNEMGQNRALAWADYFDEVQLDQIFSTTYNRTMQTALETAKRHNIEVQTYDPTKLYNEEFKTLTNGETVLIVGHSNTTPAFVNAIIGENKYSEMDDNDNATLFKVVVKGTTKEVETFRLE